MKLTALFLFAFLMHVSASTLAQKVTLNKDHITLKEVFKEIRKQTGYDVLFQSGIVNTSAVINVNFKETPLKEVMVQSLQGQPLDFVIDEHTVLIKQKQFPLIDEAKTILPSPVNISGKVTDTLGTPLIGATVTIKGTKKAVVTNDNGEFNINANTNDVIAISYIGYKSIEVVINNNTSYLHITLHPGISGLKEVIVNTGYQTLPKERATGSFAQVDNELLNRRVSPDVLSRLEGVVPGMIFNRNTSTGSQGQADISIRGNSTLFANNQPLIVVDGFPYDGDITNINPNDIDNITILKDAAAASIWGVRSGNGVIVLTTKKGKRNQALNIDFNTNITISAKPDLKYNPDYLPSAQFIGLEQQLFKLGFYDGDLNSAQPVAVSPVVQLLADERTGKITEAQLNNQLNALKGNDVRNDLSKYLYRKSVAQQYALNVRGGGERNDYYFGVGYDKDLSNLAGNQNDRLSLTSRLNFYPVKNLQISTGVSYTEAGTQLNSPVPNLNTGTHNSIYPYASLAGPQGNALPVIKTYPQAFIDTIGQGKLLDWNYRPLDELRNADNTTKTIDNRIDAGLKYSFLKHLDAQLNYQYERSTITGLNYFNADTYYARDLINSFTQIAGDGSLSYPIPVGGILQQSNSTLISNRLRAQLDYQQNFGSAHEITAIAGAEISNAVNQSNSNTAYGYNKDIEGSNASIDYTTFYNELNGNAGLIPTTLGFGKTTNRFVSYFANGAYTYSGKYTFSASGRIDKSNLFGVNTNQKAVPLFSTGASWSFSKEDFYHVGWLPYLKFRATYGYNGNINTNVTAVTTIREFDPILNVYSPIPYARIVNPGNPDLRWERIRMINLGMDFGLKDNVVSGSFEYYFKKGTDLFGNSPLAPSTGLTTFFGNTADIKGNGFDLVLNSQNINGRKFKWTTNFLFSHATDIVTKYDVQGTSDEYIGLSSASTIFPLTGKNLYGIYSYKFGGLTHNTGDPQGYDANGKLSTDYASILSNTTIQQMDFNGSARPLYFGSLRNTFSYQNFSLSINISYKLDYYFRRDSYSSAGLPWTGNMDFLRRWQKPGDEQTTNVPSLQVPPYNNNRDTFYILSSALIDKGDHVRLQDISLSYDWDKAQFPKLPFRHLQLYSYINNIAILWRANHDGLDPDLVVGSNLSTYPLPRTVSFGIKINP